MGCRLVSTAAAPALRLTCGASGRRLHGLQAIRLSLGRQHALCREAQLPNSPVPLAIIAAFLGLFLGGAAAGGVLAGAFAPGSGIAEVAGFFALPLAFAAGLQAWYGLALLGLISRLLKGLRGFRPLPVGSQQAANVRISGAFVFLPLSSVAGAAAGKVIGLASPTSPAWLVASICWLVGTCHGALAWRLARGGFLTPPEST